MKHTKFKLKVITDNHKDLIMLVDKPVIDFLELHDTEIDGDKKFYIINKTKYEFLGEVKGL